MTRKAAAGFGFVLLLASFPGGVSAHCDTMDGPVVVEAREALESGNVTPVLKWVLPSDEAEIRAAFTKTSLVRNMGSEARELADQYFFETLVRVHRAGEGAPYTGLKAAGDVEPGITLADRAIESGDPDELMEKITAHLREGIAERFDGVVEAKKRADEDVPAGREYVDAYVTLLHYVEGIVQAIHEEGPHHGNSGENR